MVILGLAGGLGYGLFADRTAPEILADSSVHFVSVRGLVLSATDAGTGIMTMTVGIRQGTNGRTLFERHYPRGMPRVSETVSLVDAGLNEGEFDLVVDTTDYPVVPLFSGNQSKRVFPLTFDSVSPEIVVRTTSHNLNQGGAGLIVYAVSGPVSRSGVEVGSRFYPGYAQKGGLYACLFACPHDVNAKDFSPKLVAEDLAGNISKAGFYYHVNARTFPKDRIPVSNSFLERVMPQFQSDFPDAGTGLDLFLRVNREMRQKNRSEVVQTGLESNPAPLWTGAFLRMGGAATEAKFAESRAYVYNGNEVDWQTHLGYDFASLTHAPVTASNRGRVVLARRLGIYGRCVILDHGLGLQTLYGHMSQLDVQEGDTVEKGGHLGISGSTGMAGGDHLHFEVNVSGTPVNPLEWLDPRWVQNNVTTKLALLRP